MAQRLQAVFEPLVGSENLDKRYQTLAAEDMSYLMDGVPGTYFFVGARDRTVEGYYGHHHPRFSIDEDALPLAVTLMSSAIAAYVLPE